MLACGDALTLEDECRLQFVFAESVRSHRLKMYSAKDACIVNPETGCHSRRGRTYVLENPHLKVYPRICGRNTLSDLNVTTHHRKGILLDVRGNQYRLWPFSDTLSVTRNVGEFQPLRHGHGSRPPNSSLLLKGFSIGPRNMKESSLAFLQGSGSSPRPRHGSGSLP